MSGADGPLTELIEREGLARWARLTRPSGDHHCVWCWQDADGWHVATTDERAVVVADTSYPTQAEAIAAFVDDLRRMKRLASRGHLD